MINKKRTWKECEDSDILAIFKEVYEETQNLYPGYFNQGVRFYIDSSKRHLGRCVYLINDNSRYNKWGYKNHFEFLRYDDVVILLSKYVTDKNAIRAVLVHEFGHLVTPTEHHSSCWKARANKIGKKWNIQCERLASVEQTTVFKANIAQQKISR